MLRAWYYAFLAVVLVLSCIIAWRNVRQGRVNRIAAIRIAIFAIAANQLYWLFSISRIPDVWDGLGGELLLTVGTSLVHGALAAIVYLALEPFLRRWWPDAIIGWTRLFSKGVNDPIVGRDILVGLAIVATMHIQFDLLTDPSTLIRPPRSALDYLGIAVRETYAGLTISLISVFVVVIVTASTGIRWLGIIAIWAMWTAIAVFGFSWTMPLFWIIGPIVNTLVLIRWGACPLG